MVERTKVADMLTVSYIGRSSVEFLLFIFWGKL